MRIRIVMYGGIVTRVYMLSDGVFEVKNWVELEVKVDYKIEQYLLEKLLNQGEKKLTNDDILY